MLAILLPEKASQESIKEEEEEEAIEPLSQSEHSNAIKANRGSAGTAPFIFTLGTGWI
jgi:hypothetical protein